MKTNRSIFYKTAAISVIISICVLLSSCEPKPVKNPPVCLSSEKSIAFVGEYVEIYATEGAAVEVSRGGKLENGKVSSDAVGDVTVAAYYGDDRKEITVRFIDRIEFQTALTSYSPHGKSCAEYLSGDYASVGKFAGADSDESKPVPVRISWKDDGYDGYTAEISDLPDFSSYHGGVCKTVKLIRPELELYNLMLCRIYYVRISAYSGNKLCAMGTFSFGTADETLRPIFIDGAINVRDLGGYELNNGRRIKQGMLYRSGRFGYADENGVFCEITDLGKAQISELGIASEIDLRGGKDGKTDEMGTDAVAENGGFGIENVTYRKIPMGYDTSETKSGTLLELEINKSAFYRIFTLLADENSYPLLFHCNIGTDRTGAVSFLILSLLGASRDDIYKDYCLSQLAPIGKNVDPDVISRYFEYIEDRYGGKCENYLADIGISQEQISKIRQILTE